MRYDTCQYGSFDALDNRREVFILFERLGLGLTEADGNERRAAFLRKLLTFSENGFAEKMVQITPCNAVDAYRIFGAITGCLGVNVDKAAKLLDNVVRKQDLWPVGKILVG